MATIPKTSGVSSFDLDLNELVEEAFERAGRELRTGYDLRTARRSLNIMFADWANRGINMWTIEPGTIDLVQGQNTYALPGDTVDLLEHVIRTGSNVAATQADLTITRISVSTYATLPNKLQQARPIQVWVQRLDGQTAAPITTLASSISATDSTISLTSTQGEHAVDGFHTHIQDFVNRPTLHGVDRSTQKTQPFLAHGIGFAIQRLTTTIDHTPQQLRTQTHQR